MYLAKAKAKVQRKDIWKANESTLYLIERKHIKNIVNARRIRLFI